MAYIKAPYDPANQWVAVEEGLGYGYLYNICTGEKVYPTRNSVTTSRRADGTLSLVPANKLAIDDWSVHKTDGVGKAFNVWESRTNYLLNSYGAANTGGAWDGWTNTGISSALTPTISTDSVYGSTAQMLSGTKASGTYSEFYRDSAVGTFSATEAANGSAYVSGSANDATVKVKLYVFDAASAYLGNVTGTGVALAASRQRINISYASLPANTSFVSCRVRIDSTGASVVAMNISAMQLEKATFPSPYIPTTTAAVTRAADVISVPTNTAGHEWSAAAGTLVAVAGVSDDPQSVNRMVCWADADGSDLYALQVYYAGVSCITRAASSYSTQSVISGISASFVGAAVFISGTSHQAFLNGTAATAQTDTKSPTLGTTALIGSFFGGANYYNDTFATIVQYNTVLTADQHASTEMQALVNGVRRQGNARRLLLGAA